MLQRLRQSIQPRHVLWMFVLVVGLLLVTRLTPKVFALYSTERGGKILSEVLQKLPNDDSSDIACDLGVVQDVNLRSRLANAAENMQKAQDYDSNLSYLYLLQGRIYCLTGDYDRAVDAYETYVSLKPKNPLGYLELGAAYELSGEDIAANDAWKKAGLNQQQFYTRSEKALNAEQYETQKKWYRRWILMEPNPTDTFEYPEQMESLVVFESFFHTDHWIACPWCNNVAGTFQTKAGILEMSYENILRERDWFAYLTYPNIHVQQFTQIVLRIKGSPGTYLTVEVIFDQVRSRPVSYQPVPEGWTTFTIPIDGDVFNQLLIGIPEPKGKDISTNGQLWIDWIALK